MDCLDTSMLGITKGWLPVPHSPANVYTELTRMTFFSDRVRYTADRNALLARNCSGHLVGRTLFPDFLAATSESAVTTRSSHIRWRNKLLPLSLRIDFRTVPYAHIPVTVCLSADPLDLRPRSKKSVIQIVAHCSPGQS